MRWRSWSVCGGWLLGRHHVRACSHCWFRPMCNFVYRDNGAVKRRPLCSPTNSAVATCSKLRFPVDSQSIVTQVALSGSLIGRSGSIADGEVLVARCLQGATDTDMGRCWYLL
ncbi:hypothetical protein VFPFJ_02074 [Purpureocillium lilacinum]|uniref:Secreted protein n=1 Tax=Purpureocillium lilacinum TaxID=33203 RepID=A0A179HU99_PURLI|nr:hypothetical protein VFPFJ_02074 [Purpureocillium lilacinum]OAQ71842.1 hypothetical protein VFPBJ_10621 [Purpureocillium lilacinum]OAQ92913.1 hypothetical protein VFPFJ_02074 [Purpureocillium lilacinum]